MYRPRPTTKPGLELVPAQRMLIEIALSEPTAPYEPTIKRLMETLQKGG